MSGKKLYLRFLDKKIRGAIELYEREAPVTSRTIWEALKAPVRVPAVHAMFAGPEIMLGLPEAAQTFDPRAVPVENQTCFPVAGDCLWFYQAEGMMRGLAGELWEIGLFYDNGGRIFGPLGWTPCNIFGRMTEGLEAFAEACRSTRIDGMQTVEIGRVE